ncbi:MAG: tRNA uridine-5-carboxymethylaminomethyl(34) synthesis GTPase MnmE [Bacilli bacterium]|nr:tRNA uridine-5-carboxymethylaminomethyl(34) synthesis GTPase MnmE [Bacilli bacterium]
MNENICAISTSLGVGAISIVRCSGPDVIKIVSEVFKGKDLNKVNTHTINYGHIIYNGEIIDEVLVSVMKKPKTFTKEDIVEINCHGGISSTNKVLEILIIKGMRLATPGEFSKKAFLNGRIDLLEAEGINDLILAETDEQRKYAINREMGNLSKLIINNRKILVELQAKLEVNFDYPEEADNIEMTHELVRKELLKIKENLEVLLNSSRDGKIVREGIDVAIVGKPNVGKSSILNHLLDEEKAIVTDIAGTTRDIVEGSITLSGIKLNLIDTAGIRKTDDIVEKIGVDKSLEMTEKADLVIFVFNNNEEISDEELSLLNKIKNVQKIVFINKSDLQSKIDEKDLKKYAIIYGNTIEPDGLETLKAEIIKMFKLDEIKTKNYNFLSNPRQSALVSSALNSVNEALKSVENEVPLEMIAADIKEAFDTLGEIIGKSYNEELLDELFSNFCLGK